MASPWNDQLEWLEADGLGGFASGTAGGIRTRRYHGLLLVATSPPTGRYMLVNGLDAFVDTPTGSFPLSTQRYGGQVVHPEGFRFIRSFTTDPWPTWRIHLPDGTVIEHELFVPKDRPTVVLSWRVCDGRGEGARIRVRPLLSGRDYHALHRENPNFDFGVDVEGQRVRWRAYAQVPPVVAVSNGSYAHAPVWYRDFFYQEEWLRGFEAVEDLASPGCFTWDLAGGEAVLVLSAQTPEFGGSDGAPIEVAERLRESEMRRRQRFETPLHRAADQYLVRRGAHKTIIAGYPWFADWGRDSFVSLRGLCLATGRLEEARKILLAWAPFVSEGMLPNRFPDRGEEPEYNSVDASLWYVIAAEELLRAAGDTGFDLSDADLETLRGSVEAILCGYARGTRYGIRADDDDGLLAAGQPGVQLTWMDAKIGDWVVTPRVGKPVEVQALWLNALALASDRSSRWRRLFERGRENFGRRFWNDAGGYLYDVVDCDGRAGAVDATFRPNQIFAVGGLPEALLEGERARRVVDHVEQKLWTPLGLRSLAPDERAYTPRYTGGPRERDAAYHQGTVWPWLTGPFVEAWVRVRGSTVEAKREARRRFVEPLMRHLNEAGLNQVSEIADAEAPHMPRGCPFQAWSVAELLRIDALLSIAPAAKPDAASLHPMCG